MKGHRTSRPARRAGHPPVLAIGLIALLSVVGGGAEAGTYQDDFSRGLSAGYWQLNTNQPLYVCDDSNGDVRLSKPTGGGDNTLQAMHVDFLGELTGDFDVSVDYRDAVIDRFAGEPGNQVQLNAWFGGLYVAVVRSDEVLGVGHNHHIWLEPPGFPTAFTTDLATAGNLRLVRTGSLVEAFVDGVMIYAGFYNADDVTRLSLSLQNNGTNDAISVTFDNFSLVADGVAAVGPWTGGSPATLAPPWPNPMTQRAQFRFELPGSGAVRLEVFDLGGRRVRTLFDGEALQGPHVVSWDGRDEGGRPQANGTYLARLGVPGGDPRAEQTQRIVLLR